LIWAPHGILLDAEVKLMKPELARQIENLSDAERNELIRALLNRVPRDSDDEFALSEEQKAELLRRVELYDKRPELWKTWDEVKAELHAKYKK
jgi:putative addiction module component (TIGR02574 family)